MSIFSNVQTAPPIEVFALTRAYNADQHPKKVNLSVGGEFNETKQLFLKVKLW